MQQAMDLAEIVRKFFFTLDESIEKLSHHNEGKIAQLPPWVLTPRHIVLGVTEDQKGIVIKAVPIKSLGQDQITIRIIKDFFDIAKITSPLGYQGPFPNTMQGFGLISDPRIVNENPLKPPGPRFKILVGFGRMDHFLNFCSEDSAKKQAVDLWSRIEAGITKSENFIEATRDVFDKFESIIKLKAFVERKVHRYIHEHSRLFLPSHKQCLFEYRLGLDDKIRKADFILEREQGLASIFIELESPVHPVFTKQGDLTKPANHAIRQISEWVSFIDKDPKKNASGRNEFLMGPKERLVIIGRGLQHRERLIDTKFSGVTLWTYDILLEEARDRWNNNMVSQYKLLGLEEIRPF